MNFLALDCGLGITGRYTIKGDISGFVTGEGTPLEESVDTPATPHRHRELIDEFSALLARLHALCIIHGDIKPSNLVLSAHGNLRFIDFAESMLESEATAPRAASTQYCSPASLRSHGRTLYKANDFYAAGVTIWQIYTGIVPFEDVSDDDLEDLIREGLRPNIELIDDPVIRTMVLKYWESGDV